LASASELIAASRAGIHEREAGAEPLRGDDWSSLKAARMDREDGIGHAWAKT
jgi:hypothetical protein